MCNCITDINKQLKETTGGFKLQMTFTTKGRVYPYIGADWAGDGKKPRGATAPFLVPTFCPFCGEKYPDDK